MLSQNLQHLHDGFSFIAFALWDGQGSWISPSWGAGESLAKRGSMGDHTVGSLEIHSVVDTAICSNFLFLMHTLLEKDNAGMAG